MLICRLQKCEAALLPELDQRDSILWLIAGGFHHSLLLARQEQNVPNRNKEVTHTESSGCLTSSRPNMTQNRGSLFCTMRYAAINVCSVHSALGSRSESTIATRQLFAPLRKRRSSPPSKCNGRYHIMPSQYSRWKILCKSFFRLI